MPVSEKNSPRMPFVSVALNAISICPLPRPFWMDSMAGGIVSLAAASATEISGVSGVSNVPLSSKSSDKLLTVAPSMVSLTRRPAGRARPT